MMPFHVWLLTIIIMALSGSVEQPLEVSMWTELPQEVIEIVMKDMSQGDLWTCRDISSCWAAAAKASGLLKLMTSLSPSAWTKVSVKLSRLHHLKISNSQVQCCLKVEPPDTAACAAMLEPLTDQGVQLPNCKLLVALRYQEDLECDLATEIRNIAEASAILQEKGVELCVQLQPSSAEFAVPPPDVLTQLAPVIQRIKCYKLKTARCPSEDFHRAYCFSASHISALSDARTSLQELCMSDHNVGTLNDTISDASMASIATFSSLTRLDLVCYGCPALDSLGQLSHLQKLALHLRLKGSAREPCCEAVLLNNNAGLKKVQLDGYAWSDATYLALLTLTSLKVLALNVATISSLSAHVLGNVVATRCISIWFCNSFSIAGSALQGLTSSCANITSLRLDYMPLDKFQHLCTMEHLSSLVIVNSGSFTGSELVTQPNVCHLDLVSCCDLDTEGLRHIVCVFPNLTSIGMVKDSKGRWPRVRIDSFVEISQLRKLELVDLSGLASITADQAEALEHAIRAQQELGLLQRDVRLRLPRIPYDGTCTQLWINSSHQQFFGGIEPGEQLEVALERYCHQQRAIAGAKLMLRCYMTATVIKGASRFAAKVSRLL